MDSYSDVAELTRERSDLLDTALARIRTGWRIRCEKNGYVVYGPHGDATGITPEARHALVYYMVRASMGPQEPITNKLTMDFLPAEQEQADVLDDRLRVVHWSEM